MNAIIFDAMGTFKLNSIIRKAHFKKQGEYRVTEILALMIILPLLLLNSVNSFYKSEFRKVTQMKKDAIDRLKNHAMMPWRDILYGVAKRFQTLTNPEKVVADTSAFIIDDTTDARVGRRIENVSYIFDHVVGKTRLGFKDPVLGYFDGKSFIPLDFSIHSEKGLRGKPRIVQYKKPGVPGSPGNTRRQECTVDKITQAMTMIKRAVKHGFRAKYVLTDSGFRSKGFIQTVRQIKSQALHVVCGVRKDKRQYTYQGKKMDVKALHAMVKKKEGNAKRCRKLNTRYFEVVEQ
ncbi:MAG: transposase [Firmicutes bacterium]|nr:transposase [Bacillota bacterium]